MTWKKGPLPANTWNWGGVVPTGADPSLGFFFADFCGDHVKLMPAAGGKDRLEAGEVGWYDNCLELPGPSLPELKGRASSAWLALLAATLLLCLAGSPAIAGDYSAFGSPPPDYGPFPVAKKTTCGDPSCDCGCQDGGPCTCGDKNSLETAQKGVASLKVSISNDWGKATRQAAGFVIDQRGFLLTCAHVVADAKSITVTLSDGTKLDASVFCTIPGHDLAVLRLEKSEKKLTVLSFASSGKLRSGQKVYAVGNPLGYEGSTTSGVISATGRKITMPSDEVLTGIVQHDAAINEGNSGGPLLDEKGRVIGINVAYRNGARNISFAVASDDAVAALASHMSAEKVSGIKHGLKADSVVRAGALKVNNAFDLERAMWGYKAGEKINLVCLRDGGEVKESLTLEGIESKRRIEGIVDPSFDVVRICDQGGGCAWVVVERKDASGRYRSRGTAQNEADRLNGEGKATLAPPVTPAPTLRPSWTNTPQYAMPAPAPQPQFVPQQQYTQQPAFRAPMAMGGGGGMSCGPRG